MSTVTKRVLRHEVPMDDQWHTIDLDHNPLPIIECGTTRRVMSFWAENNGGPPLARTFRVFATGQPIPDDARWTGTGLRADGLVFHLYERR